MKSSTSLERRVLAKCESLSLALLFALPTLLRAANPGVTATSNFHIFDTQATNVFAGATVSVGDTNDLTVIVSFDPTIFGTLNPLPAGVVQDGTNYLISATNAMDATAQLNSLVFTPVANRIPVPSFTNVVFEVHVEDALNDSSPTRSTTVRVISTNDPPTLTAAAPFTQNITDQASTQVFTGVTIADVDNNGAQPVIVTISLDVANKGTFTNLSGFALSGGNYVFTGPSAAATTAIRALRFVPRSNFLPPGQSETTTFTLSVDDNFAPPATSSAYSVTALSVNDAPTLAPGTPVAFFISDQATNTRIFTNVTILDPDLSGTQYVSVTIALNATNRGLFALSTNGPPGFTNVGVNYAFTGTPAAATTAIRALVFLPTPNFVPVGQSNTTAFTIAVDDDIAAPLTNTAFSVNALSINDPPELTGVTGDHVPVETGRSISPFAVLTLLDADQNRVLTNTHGEDLAWEVTLSGDSPLGNLELNGVNIGDTYSSTSDPEVATAGLRALIYRAPTIPIVGTNTLTLAITANDGHNSPGSTVSNAVVLDLFSLVLPPVLSGTEAGQLVNDNTTRAPFSKVNLQSFNGSSITVRIRLAGVTNDAPGQLINLGGFTRRTNAGAPSLYEFTGTSESATAGIRALLFQPTPNRLNGSSNETATFSITLVDGVITNSPDLSTTVIVVPVNDPPVIVGISPLVTIQDNQTLPPFTTVLITDADELGKQPITAAITLDLAAKGSFTTNSLSASGFSSNSGSYTFTGPAGLLTPAIRQLVFIPAPNRVPVGLTEITTFTINLNDAHGGLVANSGTSVRVASVSGLPVVNLPTPQPVSIPIDTNIYPFPQVSVSDPTLLQLNVRIVDSTQGAFTSNSVLASGFTNRGGGNYFVSGYASNVTAALAQLDFAPAGNLPLGAVINFTISVTNALPNFTAVNLAIVLRTVQNSFIVTKLTDYDPAANVPVSQQQGTLRNAIAAAKNNDHITFDIRSLVAGRPDYPAVLRLVAPLVLDNNLTFDGPGAERLALSGDSDGDGTADVQLFVINAAVTMHRLTFTKGFASGAGGAFAVSEFGDLRLRYCAVTDSTAEVWGGGVDVDQGSLVLDHCLIAGNRTSSALGQGGGGVSLFTYWPCAIVATTFATNRQEAVGGLGGGALYAETADPGTPFELHVLNCTFHDNRDLAGHGTSIRPNVFNTRVQLQNTIVADGQGKNIEMDQSGAVFSLGGNISDDATASIFSAGGAPTNTFIFHPPADQVNVPATNLLSALANNGGPTWTFALTSNSPAIGQAVSNFPGAAFYATRGTDQRGYFRDGQPDIGAFERGASQRIIIEEIHFNPAAPNTNDEFIEFYVPRDSTALDLGGFSLLVDGTLRHTFTSQALQPGEALVLFSAGAVNNTVPSGVYRQIAAGNLLLDNAGGVITLRNAANQTVFEADYVGAFTATDPNDYGFLAANHQSLVLSPQFQGVFLPYQRVVAKEGGSATNGFANPGYDVTGNPLALGNAPPLAYDDLTATDAHTPLPSLAVMNNDTDLDLTDVIRVVAVGTNGNVLGATNYSVLGARLIIHDSPTAGATVHYDPTASPLLTSLPQGSNVVDTFQYSILDSSNGVDHVRGATAPEIALNLAKATATVTVNIVGVNAAPTPQPDAVNTNAILTTAEDVLLDFTTAANLLVNDTDPNSDDDSSTLNIVSISPTNGYVANRLAIVTALGATATLDIRFDRSETHLTYDPRGSAILNALGLNQTTNDTFYYSVKDRYNAVGTASVSITVTGVNDTGTANPNFLATDEDTAVTTSAAALLANDTDPDLATVLTISAVTPKSALGADVILSGTDVIYDPTTSSNLNALANKEFATDTFTYTATDEHGLSSNAVVTVLVAGLNDRPISQADADSIDEDTLYTATAPGVLGNDREPDVNGLPPDDSFRVIPFANYLTTEGASVTMAADGSFTLDPRGVFDWLKQAQPTNQPFDYVVMDHSLSVAKDDDFAVTATTTNNLLPVLANDVVMSLAGGAFGLTSVSAPNHGGSVALNAASNAVLYTPLAGYVGTETFSYAVADGLGGSDTASVTVSVTGSRLYAIADSFTVAKGTTNTLDLLVNDSILPATGAAMSIAALGTPGLGGAVSFNGVGPNNFVNYTPNPTQPTPFVETFGYTVSSASLVATGVVSVTVIDRGNSLAAKNDNFTVIANSGNISLNVLANDLILPGPNTNLVITSFVSNSVLGSVSLNAARTRLVYKPSSSVTNHQEPLISYTISDNAGGTATASVSIRVVPSGFIANDDTFVVVKNSTNTLPVMVNDVILPNLGQTLFISGIGIGPNAPNRGGSVALNGPGTGLIYSPAAGYTGGEDFTYEISDGSPARALGRVHVVVMDNSPATSNPDTYRVARDSANNALLVIKNDYPLPKTPGAFTITAVRTNGAHATVAVNGAAANNSLLYSPTAGFIGTDLFQYEFTDTLGNRGTNNVTVAVGNLAPRDDAFSALSDSAANVLEVLANDPAYPDLSSVRTIHLLGVPDQGGSVVTNATATAVLYTPAPGFVGVEHFSYALKDDSTNLFSATATVKVYARGSDRNTNTVTLTIIGVNDVPTISGSTNRQITDKQTVQPFSTITIADLDEYGFQLQTVQIAMDHLDNGALQILGGFTPSGPGLFTLQGTPAALTAALRGILFVPVENHIMVPTTEITHLTLSVDDGDVATPVTNLTTVAVTAVDDSPAISGSASHQITDQETVQPFSTITIADVDDDLLQSQTVQIFMDQLDNGELQNLGGFTQNPSGVFTLAGTPADLTTALRGIVFVPTPNHITVPTTETTRLTLTINDAFLPTVTNDLTTVAITATNDAPTIAGTASYQITDKQTVHPFGTVTIADVDDDASQPVTVRVAMDNLDKQTLTNLGGFTQVTNGLFSLTATPTNLTTALRGIVFVPVPNHIPVPTTVTTHLTLTVNDGFAPTLTNNLTTVAVTATNDTPTIAGTGNYQITDKQTFQPFGTVTIADVDDDASQPLTVRIVMDNLDKQTLTHLGGFTEISSGLFTLSGTPADLTAALRGIVYHPVPNHIPVPTTATTHLTLSANDGFITTPVTNLTTVAVTAVNDPPTISGTVAGQTVFDRSPIKPLAGVTMGEADDDTLQALRVTVTLDDATHGLLSSLGGFVNLGGGVYRLGTTNAGVTAALASQTLRALVFNPTTTNRVTPTSPETTRFTIAVEDGFAPTVVDNLTTVIAIHEFQTKALAADGISGDYLGFAVAASYRVVVAGAPLADPRGFNSGAAYIYTHDSLTSTQWTQFQKLVPSDGVAGDQFGHAVAHSGNTIAVSAHLHQASGAVYVFERADTGSNLWALAKKVVPFDGASGDDFGSSVSLDKDTLVVGARADDDNGLTAGTAFVYHRNQGGSNTWGFVKKLIGSDAAAGDEFGFSVSVEGDTIIVGSHLDVQGGSATGSAYLFRRNQGGSNNWGQLKKLALTDGVGFDEFGHSVSVYGDIAVVGASRRDNPGNDTGATYIFQRDLGGADNWGLRKQLLSPTAMNNDQFGYSVSLHRDKLVVGLPFSGFDNQSKYGTAYSYARHTGGTDNWGVLQGLGRPDPANNDQFGIAVAVGQDTAVVGANQSDARGNDSGSLYIYRLKFNNPPLLVIAIPDQTAITNTPFTFNLPTGTFADPDVGDLLTLTATLADGSPMPEWLNFNAATATFSGTPTVSGMNSIRVNATDEDGATVSVAFSICVAGETPCIEQPPLYLTMTSDVQIGKLLLSYVRPAGALSSRYRLQVCGDLGPWNSGDSLVLSETITAIDAATEQVTLRLDRPASAARFFRIEVTNN